jgi:hypothetical protein
MDGEGIGKEGGVSNISITLKFLLSPVFNLEF